MEFKDLFSSQFLVIDADWPRRRALDVSSKLDSGYLIVRKAMEVPDQSAEFEFYAFAIEEAVKKLRRSRAREVGRILNLDHPAPTLGVDTIEVMEKDLDLASAGLEPTALDPLVARMLDAMDPTVGVVINGGEPVGVIGSSGVSDNPPPPPGGGSPPAPGGGSPPPPTGDGTVTRHLAAEMPTKVKLLSRFTLTVELSSIAAPRSNAATVRLPPGSKIDVIVNAVERLRVVGEAMWSCEVTDPQPKTLKEFTLEATEKGEGHAEVCAYYKSGAVATIPLTSEIVEVLPAAAPATRASARPRMDSERQSPDLTLFVLENTKNKEIEFFLQSKDGRYTGNRYGPKEMKAPREYFDDFFRKIEKLSGDKARRELEVQGLALFRDALPDDLQTELWSLREQVQTLHILSDEPWVPWEVCRMEGRVDGRFQEGPFFGEAFNVTRWIRAIPVVPTLSLRKWAIVVPPDSELTAAPLEKEYLLRFNGGGRDVVDIPPTLKEVTKAMASGNYDVWHFTGHARAAVGENANNATIELKKPDKMTPDHILGATQNVLLKRPLVFLNACQSGRGGMALSGTGGWAERLLKVKKDTPSAGAFIGTYWSVDDATAFAFAKAFYDRLMANMPIAQAAREARMQIKNEGDPSWLAYTVYADPFARLA